MDNLKESQEDRAVIRAYLDEKGMYKIYIITENCFPTWCKDILRDAKELEERIDPMNEEQRQPKIVPLFPVSKVRKVETSSAKDLIHRSDELLNELDELLEKLKDNK
ncbi:hypothetical protein [Halobacillus dabanensis]|uniref:hypothetical protein n=1 Tax=Halobacillus dabanensis TaxID=240302 RepID=UPI0014289BDC|nr:hypothetical protein [Halobacillus dabanensis]